MAWDEEGLKSELMGFVDFSLCSGSSRVGCAAFEQVEIEGAKVRRHKYQIQKGQLVFVVTTWLD
jgi:hypothetical protein